jgi:hypothetical protein
MRCDREAPGARAALPPGARPAVQAVLGVVAAEALEVRTPGQRPGTRPRTAAAHALGRGWDADRQMGDLQADQGQQTGDYPVPGEPSITCLVDGPPTRSLPTPNHPIDSRAILPRWAGPHLDFVLRPLVPSYSGVRARAPPGSKAWPDEWSFRTDSDSRSYLLY